MRYTSIALIAGSFLAVGLSTTDAEARHRRRCCRDRGRVAPVVCCPQPSFGGACCDNAGLAYSAPSHSYGAPATASYGAPMTHSAGYGPVYGQQTFSSGVASNCQPNYANWNQPQPYGSSAPPAPQTFAPADPNAPMNQDAPANQNPPAAAPADENPAPAQPANENPST